MIDKYDKNFTEDGNLVKYEKVVSKPAFINRVLQFKIVIQDIEPPIWRRILVPSDYNFWDLHIAIIDSLGWSDFHLHHFEATKKKRATPDIIGIPDLENGNIYRTILPGWEIPILAYFYELGIEANYYYDYGDSWCLTVQLEGYVLKNSDVEYPICIDGERAGPPEDCGGVPGYYQIIKILSDKNDEEYEEIRDWVGKSWNPEKFDKNKILFDDPLDRLEFE